MNLFLFNVDFGECCLLKENNENLLVDFGTDSKHKQAIITDITNNIQQLCKGEPLSVLLTHFHDDHVNGLTSYLTTPQSQRSANAPFQFQTFYIPDIFAQSYSNTGIGYIHLLLLKDIFDAIILHKKPIISLYELLKAFVNNKSRIRFLKRGDTFSLSNTEFDVLWPCFECIKIHKKTVNRTINALSQLSFIHTTQQQNQITFSVDDHGYYIEIIDDFVNQLSAAFLMLQQTNAVDPNIMAQLRRTYDKLADKCVTITLSSQTVTASYLKSVGNSLVNEANKFSIVFQDVGTPNSSKLLMTGDITKAELAAMINGKVMPGTRPQIKKEYKLIKSPHHGTQSHFVPDLPKCSIITASNGSTSHTKWGKIAFEYGALYVSNRHSEMLCTNSRCVLVDLNKQGKATRCRNCPNSPQPFYSVIL